VLEKHSDNSDNTLADYQRISGESYQSLLLCPFLVVYARMVDNVVV
jgi:hypothetical protein